MMSNGVQLTIRSHYNPCFWTANWNPAYLKAVQSNMKLPSPREQAIKALNIFADKILPSTTENVHFEKNGILKLSKEEAKRTCELWMPDDYQKAWEEIDASTGTGYALHVEAIQSHLENSSAYLMLKSVIKRASLSHTGDKPNLAWAIVLQHLRNPWILKSIGEVLEANGRTKLELFLSFARLLNNAEIMMPTIRDVANGEWIMYKTYNDEFPLVDSAVLIEPDNKLIALSPRLLLEIRGSDPRLITSTSYRNSVPPAKMDEFRRRSIANTFKEIIFGSDGRLQEWKDSPEFAVRRQTVLAKNIKYQIPYAGEAVDEAWLMKIYHDLLFPTRL